MTALRCPVCDQLMLAAGPTDGGTPRMLCCSGNGVPPDNHVCWVTFRQPTPPTIEYDAAGPPGPQTEETH